MATKATTRAGAGAVTVQGTKSVGQEPIYYVITTIRYAVLILMTIIFLGPFIMALLGSFKDNNEVLAWPPTFLPTSWHFDNYSYVWNVLPDPNGNSYFPRWILNSFILSASIVILQLFFCSLAGFAFARLNFPGKGIVFAAMLSTMMIPGMVLLLPKYQILNAVGLVNTYGALIIPGMVSAGMIFMLTQFFRSIPKDLDEAAWMDGAGIFTTYWRIILPLARPALATLALLTFQGVWNTYLDALILLNTPDKFPLTVGLGFLKGQYATAYNLVLAGSMFNTLPMVLLFMIFSRFYVQGATYSGVKG
jgi:ABC-type glycerol-3-phosphate transport system permease component